MDFASTEEQEEPRENARGFLEEFSGSEQMRRWANFKRARSSEILLGDAAYHRELLARLIGL